jgi:ABC-type amino acid transport substrate-binding protein
MFEKKDLGRMTSTIRAAARVVAAGALLAGFLGAAPASAEVARVVTADFAPLTDNSSPDKKGLLHDLVREMLKLQKVAKPIEFMAWPDAVKIVDETVDVLIFPMTRTPQREEKYQWEVKIFDMNRSFAGRPGSAPVNTVEDAKKLKAVGTTVNSASLGYLKQKGLTNIVEFPTSRDLMKGLFDAKIDAAYQPDPFTKTDWKAAGGQGALVFGEPQERSAAYLAANKGSTLKPTDWQEALHVLEQDGTFETLVKAYGMD